MEALAAATVLILDEFAAGATGVDLDSRSEVVDGEVHAKEVVGRAGCGLPGDDHGRGDGVGVALALPRRGALLALAFLLAFSSTSHGMSVAEGASTGNRAGVVGRSAVR